MTVWNYLNQNNLVADAVWGPGVWIYHHTHMKNELDKLRSEFKKGTKDVEK